MKITNNTGKLIILLNGRKIPKYSTIEILKNLLNKSLMEQIENLSKMGMITTEL